jgi:hypothetical protein
MGGRQPAFLNNKAAEFAETKHGAPNSAMRQTGATEKIKTCDRLIVLLEVSDGCKEDYFIFSS